MSLLVPVEVTMLSRYITGFRIFWSYLYTT